MFQSLPGPNSHQEVQVQTEIELQISYTQQHKVKLECNSTCL